MRVEGRSMVLESSLTGGDVSVGGEIGDRRESYCISTLRQNASNAP